MNVLTNEDLYKIREGIQKCAQLTNVADINFAMTMARIATEVEKEIKIIELGKRKPSERYKEYLKKAKEIDIKYAVQKEDGSFHMLNNQIIIKDAKKYYIEINALREEYKVELDEAEKIQDEFTKFLDQTCKVTLTKLPKNIIPAQVTVEQLCLLYPVIE